MFKKFFKCFILMLAAYIFLMIAVFTIPNKYLEQNVRESISLINNEGLYPELVKNDKGSKLDNFTDRLMLEKSVKDVNNPIKAAMSINGYSRYWHGYQILLRPILIFIGYGNIRQLYGLLITILIGLNFFLLVKRLDVFMALAFIISLYFVRFYTFFLSMQFANVFIIMLLFNMYLLTRKAEVLKRNFFLSFFIVGSLTNFIDLLTVPMITLGVPLVILFYFKISNSKKMEVLSISSLLEILFTSVFWGIGYGVTWFSKWCVATSILRKNVISDALNKALFRTEGNKDYPLNRSEMLHNNIGLIIDKFWLILFALFVIMVVLMVIYKKDVSKKYFNINSTYLIVIASFPYIWYMILANHSQIHYWFTYRLQVVSIFAILSFLSYIMRILVLPEKRGFSI